MNRTLFATAFALLLVLLVPSCQQRQSAADNETLCRWKNNPHQLITDSEAASEIDQKIALVKQFLNTERLDGIMLTQVRNVNWITAGLANTQIVLNKDVGAASLLIMKDGKKYLLCSGSEAGRLMDGSLGKLGYELKQFNWYEANPILDVRGKVLAQVAPSARIGSDAPFPGTVPAPDSFKKLRYSFLPTEIKRYEWLGKEATQAIEDVCRAVQPGMSEYEIEAMTAQSVRSRGLFPTVLLTAVDERIYKYRHALPGGAALKNYAMINIVAEKWGMPVAVTRFVHFGPLPEDLAAKFTKTAKIFTQYQLATVPGTPCASIFEQCKQWYAEAGYPGEWEKHHQGGAIGYDDREYVIYPGVQETVQDRQAFAWNPTITGAKIEDTFIAYKDHFEVVTKTGNWPSITVELNGKKYEQPGVLIR